MRTIATLFTTVLAAAAFTAFATAGQPVHRHASSSSAAGAASQQLATKLALSRLATAKYVDNLTLAKRDGYGVITQMIPDMGWHFMNPKITAFDVTKPAILVYGKRGARWQLGALEWVFPKLPAKPPVPGARYGAFGAACHYVDGTFVFTESQDRCAARSPETGARFNFWHPPLVTMHIWLWYPNPSGLYASMNPLVHPFNKG